MATASDTKPSTTTGRKSSDPPETQASKSTNPTTIPPTSPSDPTSNFEGDIDVNNNLPTAKEISKAGELPILDANGTSHTFKSLYTPNQGTPKRALIIFVRHFFCGNCQEYLRTLCASITPTSLSNLPIPTTLTVIGCGSPSLISMYASSTSCTFPIYADPTYALYSCLKMTRTLSLGPKKPDYLQTSQVYNALKSIVQGLGAGLSATKGGDYKQVGGEFLWSENGSDVLWCHRMKNTRDHAEIPVLREAVGLDGVGGLRRRKSTGPGELLRRTSRSWSRRRSGIVAEGGQGEKRSGSVSTKERERRGIREEVEQSEGNGNGKVEGGGDTNGHSG
ncbi:MAG: hypothetical protein M1812_006031 [Candelaria pacifica]|nr:MAG: hypothetical protein M1812_006031 [Candelaria pacifica]